MNLPFLKLRVADCAWVLFDRWEASGEGELPWASIAVGICDRYRGAAAVGLVAVKRQGDANLIETWDASGEPIAPPPSASLCASRLLFDAGRAGPDSVEFRSSAGTVEALVIDSRVLSLPLGVPLREDGGPLGDAYGSGGLRLSAAPGSVVVMPVVLNGEGVEVALYDRPPAGRRARSATGAGNRRVEALAVSRQELRVLRRSRDPLVAAAAATAAAIVADYADRECAAMIAGHRLAAQWPEDGPVFVAAAPEYCFSGDFWVTER
jgi:hypothetical protein